MAAQWYQQEPSRSLSQPQPASWAYPCELALFSYLVSRVTSFFLPVSQNVSRGAEVVGVGFLDCLHDNESTESTDHRLQTASPLTPHLSSPPQHPALKYLLCSYPRHSLGVFYHQRDQTISQVHLSFQTWFSRFSTSASRARVFCL